MIQFLLKGILRDARRSRLPIIIISIGVFLTVVMTTFMSGVIGDMLDMTAKFQTGHVKVMTRAYADNADLLPNDLAILEVDELITELEQTYPKMEWAERIRFGGLVDVPDEQGETREQGPASAQAVDLFSPNSKEVDRLNIRKSMVTGDIPSQPGDILLSDDFAKKLGLSIGDKMTFFGSTMDGSMTFKNFRMSGTLRFGTAALDRGSVILDISDARQMLDMEDAIGELLGYASNGTYDDNRAVEIANEFNAKRSGSDDEFAPIMFAMRDMNDMGAMIDYTKAMTGLMAFIFVFAMSIVLWNTGLLGGLRRYREFGIRLAMGEEKRHIYKTLIYEALLIGALGSIIGTILGLAVAWPLQEFGLDFSSMTQNVGMMLPAVYKAKITATAFFIGFIPGVFSMVFGNALSGIGIYKRKTAQLFKELEV
ncbi:MAG: FtsX-like permease family protein [Bacteroidota bacterium]